MKEKEANLLRVMFPEDEVELWPGTKVKVRPLSLEDLPKVLGTFKSILDAYSGNKEASVIEIGSAFAGALVDLIPYCAGVKASEVPLTKVPEIIDIIVKQNFPPDALGKWKALFSSVAGLVEEQGGLNKLSNNL